MEQKDLIVRLLRELAETLRRSSDAEIEALLSGRATLADLLASPAFGARADGKATTKKRVLRNNKRLAGLAAQLRQLPSREEGVSFLVGAQLLKNELEELARMMDLPVLREDDADRLRQKIIESSIGSRLNSRAINPAS